MLHTKSQFIEGKGKTFNFLPRLLGIAFFVLLFASHARSESEYPSLWDSFDPTLEKALEAALREEASEEFWQVVERKKVGIAVVDITDLDDPKVAAINGDVMMYAASLPKIAILLGALVQIERGDMELNDETRASLTRMIRNSSNKDATAILNRVGFENLADLLQSERFRLYDPKHNGGLWVGRDYGGGRVWKRDPLHGISHGATAMQAARFYYLGVTGRLVAPELRSEVREIMSRPAIKHKFVKGLAAANPEAAIYRKSGTWRQFHADSGVIVAKGHRYIVAALAEHPRGAEGMAKLIGLVDRTVAGLRGVEK